MLDGLKSKATRTAKRAGLLSGGLLAICVGLAFFTGAAWLYLSAVTDPLTAALVLGGAYLGLGLLTIGIALSGGSEDHHAATLAHGPARQEPQAAQPPLMQAFLHGMQAGVSATQHRR